MKALPSDLRNKLERTIIEARNVAEEGAQIAIKALAVHHYEPYKHQTPDERKLRVRLRAHARQLGDKQSPKDELEISHLVHECAYEHWHRMLFARFLAENDLLIEPEYGVAISLQDCEELAREKKVDTWELAAEYAQRMLPQIFRTHDPVLEVQLTREYRLKLEKLLQELKPEVFQADDSLGWVYQFWQSQKKKEVNESGVKIGADELPAVTQLFTEDYMVLFLLHNTIGAWWAGKKFSENPDLALISKSEDELRRAVSLPGIDWEYLRFIREDDGKGAWRPAAGTFDGWPKDAKDVTILDPCMGSGHFLIAAFQIMVPIRMKEEGLSKEDACNAVLRENIYGLEIDQRCSQIAAFALAFTAWKITGFRELPRLNLACSGIGIHTKQEDWLALGKETPRLKGGMERLYQLFKDAPTLGSLIDPKRALGARGLFVADFGELQPLFQKALEKMRKEEDEAGEEMAVAAQGIAHAAEILSEEFTLVATNVPYLGREGHILTLMEFADNYAAKASADLATIMLTRIFGYLIEGGSCCVVLPQNWWVGRAYSRFRQELIRFRTWVFTIVLGEEAWETFGNRGPNTLLTCYSNTFPREGDRFVALDLSSKPRLPIIPRAQKIEGLTNATRNDNSNIGNLVLVRQDNQIDNPDSRISLQPLGTTKWLSEFVISGEGCSTGDADKFLRYHWEINWDSSWIAYLTPDGSSQPWGGRELLMFWEGGKGELADSSQARIQNTELWTKQGVLVGRVRGISTTLFDGGAFSKGGVLICPRNENDLPKLYHFLKSKKYETQVRALDSRVSASTSILTKIRFDMNETDETELPKKQVSDPKQWLFNGHPKGSDEPLQVGVSRLLGYHWPRQTGSSFTDCPTLGPDGLEQFADEDGIVCLPSIRGEDSGASRLRALLSAAFGKEWSLAKERELAAATGSDATDLEQWLYNDFFEQHGKLFHHRPFIWHIWDGRARDGFHALVNYHKLAEGNGKGRRLLEKVIYSYLGDWIKRQEDGIKRGEAGSESRLVAASALRDILVKILEGEPPFDIFVRWKPLHEQPIGWEPDINDGVRLNIRPFLSEDLPKGKKGAGVLRWKPNIKWGKDRGNEPSRKMDEFPWFFGWDEKSVDFAGKKGGFDGNRWNDCHYTNEFKRNAREMKKKGK